MSSQEIHEEARRDLRAEMAQLMRAHPDGDTIDLMVAAFERGLAHRERIEQRFDTLLNEYDATRRRMIERTGVAAVAQAALRAAKARILECQGFLGWEDPGIVPAFLGQQIDAALADNAGAELLALARAADKLDQAISEFGMDPASISEIVQEFSDKVAAWKKVQ